MTDQTCPSITFRNEVYWLIREIPFSPYEHGIGAYELSTAQVLGFDASFEVVDDCIYLKSLMTTHDDNHIALPIEPTGESSIETDVEWEHVSLEDLIKPAPGVGKSGPPPELNGITPQKSYAKQWFYEDVMMPLTYTGSLHLSTREMLETALNDELFQAPNGWLLECDNGRVIEARKIDNLNALFDEKT